PRPRNAWILYRLWWCENHKDEFKGSGNKMAELSKAAARVWNSLPQEERLYWALRGVEEEQEHNQKYPNYKFRP
ncbi:hypothetical protein BDZ94DRAFT_1149100, partial [Collybia nuda]